MTSLRKPLLALVLAIIPFFVFVGSQSTVQVNGVTTSDTRFNILGIALGALAIGMAVSMLRRAALGRAGKALAALAGVVGIVQLAAASGQIRVDPWDWISPDRNLPALQYAGPGINMDDKVYVVDQTPAGYKAEVRARTVDLIRYTRAHVAYADQCHNGRYRVKTEKAFAIPDFFTAEEKAAILGQAERFKVTVAAQCTPQATQRAMGPLVDQINSDIDVAAAFERKYHKAAG